MDADCSFYVILIKSLKNPSLNVRIKWSPFFCNTSMNSHFSKFRSKICCRPCYVIKILEIVTFYLFDAIFLKIILSQILTMDSHSAGKNTSDYSRSRYKKG